MTATLERVRPPSVRFASRRSRALLPSLLGALLGATGCGGDESAPGPAGAGGTSGATSATGAGGGAAGGADGSGTTSTTSTGSGAAGGSGATSTSTSASTTGAGGGATALDPTFGKGGVATAGAGASSDRLRAMARQADGKLVLVGTTAEHEDPFDQTSGEILIVRMDAGGAVDPGFGDGGRVLMPLLFRAEGRGVAIRPDGKIVVTGMATRTSGQATGFVARFAPDGALDPTFGGGAGYVLAATPGAYWSVALQPDGKIVTAGLGTGLGKFAVFRHAEDGAPDAAFGAGGVAAVDLGLNSFAFAVALADDGRIVAAGRTTPPKGEVAVVRLTPGGALDPSFSGDGIALTPHVHDGSAEAVLVRPDGKIVVAGWWELDAFTDSVGVVLRHNENGDLDPSFGGGDGIFEYDPTPYLDSFAVLAPHPDGGLFVGGARGGALSVHDVLRLSEGGAPDPAYGAGGVAQPLGDGGLAALTAAPDGSLFAAGHLYEHATDTSDFVVARLDPDGSIDPGFGASGLAAYNSNAAREVGAAFVLQPDGKVVGAGWRTTLTRREALLVRWTDGGEPDPAFGASGVAPVAAITRPCGIALQADGKIVVAGAQWGASLGSFAVTRHDASGAIDASYGEAGVVSVKTGASQALRPQALALDAAGNVLLAGATKSDFSVVRITPAGAVDPSWGEGGKSLVPLEASSGAFALAAAPGGEVLVAGNAGAGAAAAIVVARHAPDGALDPTFGQGGLAKLPEAFLVDRMRLLPGGKILLAGFRYAVPSEIGILRLDASGALDPTFGEGGVVYEVHAGQIGRYEGRYEGPGLDVDPQGRILVATATIKGDLSRMLALRYLPDGVLDPTFGEAGRLPVPSLSGNWHAFDALLRPDGMLVLAGRGFSAERGTDFAAVRLVP